MQKAKTSTNIWIAVLVSLVIVALGIWGVSAFLGAKKESEPSSASEATTSSRSSAQPKGNTGGSQTVLIGDSVVIASKPVLEERFPSMEIDAGVSRQLKNLETDIEKLKAANSLRDIVAVSLGTNGTADESVLDASLKSLGPNRQMVLVTPNGTRDWVRQAQELLRGFAAKNPQQVVLADWAAAAGRVTDFAADGIHPGRQGAGVYADVLKSATDEASARLK